MTGEGEVKGVGRGKAYTIALPISSFLPNLGGMEVGLHNIATRLQAAGHRPVVIAPHSHVKQLRAQGWSLPYEVVAFPPKILSYLARFPKFSFLAFDLFFAHLQRRFGFDVWHVTMGYPLGVAMVHFAQWRKDIRYLIRCAGDDIQMAPDIGYGMRLNPVVDTQVRDYFPKAQALTAISESVAEEYRAIGVSEPTIRYIPNGVDLTRFSETTDRAVTREQFGLDANAFLFLAVGRNHPKKNYAALIQAAVALKAQSDTPFQVVIVGRGVEELDGLVQSVEAPVRLIPEIGDVRTAGRVPDMPGNNLVALYQAADAFAFPSKMETFGIAIVEAMAAGLPVLVGDAPGCRDIVRGGEHGLMARPDDVETIAAQMRVLLDDDAARSDWTRRAVARAKDFSWDSVVERYLDLYEELISR